MNPVPTDAQWLVLYQIDDGDVWFAGNGVWRAKSPVGHFNVTRMILKLLDLDLIKFGAAHTIEVTAKGMEALKRRSVYDVLERRNRRSQ